MKLSPVLLLLLLNFNCASVAHAHGHSDAGVVNRNYIDILDVEEENMYTAFREFNARVEAGEKHVYFRINSFGGSIFLGLEFIQAIEDLKLKYGVHTTCVVDSKAMSMGMAILQSGACDERVMTKRSTLLTHMGSGGVRGTADQMEEAAEIIRALSYALTDMIADRMGVDHLWLRNKIEKRAWTVAWDDALKYNMVDRVE